MTERVLDEVGYYLLAGAGGEGPATLMDEPGAAKNSASARHSSPSVGTSRRHRPLSAPLAQ